MISQNKCRSLFKKLSDFEKNTLLNSGEIMSYKKGDILFDEKDSIDYLYIIIEGYIALYRNSRYSEIKIIFICTEGEILNETVLQDAKTSICAKALSDGTILAIQKEKILQIMQENQNIALHIYESLAMKTRRLYHQVGNANGTYPLEKHLAAKLWKLARDYGIKSDKGIQIAFEITVTFLANMLGAKRESVSRIISVLKKDNILMHENGYMTILDMEKIKEKAM